MRIFSICLFAVMLSGCIPYSDNPLTAPEKEQIDKSIIGTWFWNDENESGYIHIGLDPETKLLRLIMADIDKNNEIEISEFSGHTSSIEGRTYLNLKWTKPEQKEITGYLLVKYAAGSDLLTLSIMSYEATEKAIESGQLKGMVKKGRLFSWLQISEPQEKLKKFVVANDKVLFPEMVNLPKLKLPDHGME